MNIILELSNPHFHIYQSIINLPWIFHLSTIFVLYLCTWYKSIRGGFLIDDDQGIQKFSEKWIKEVTPQGQFIREYRLDYEEDGEGDKKKKYPYLGYHHKFLGFPGAFMRWHRLHIGKKFTSIGKNQKGHDIYGYIQDPKKHHIWSLFVQSINLVLTYFFLAKLFNPNIAFLSTLLFSVYPLGCQVVAWISGVNYAYSMIFSVASFLTAISIHNLFISIPLVILFTFLSSITLLSGCFGFLILLLLGRYWEALASFIVGILVFLRDGKSVVSLRISNFKKQDMEESTKLKIRKIFVVLKTFAYYVFYVPFPKSMGLYHEFGYHYDEMMERFDHRTLLGLIALIAAILGIIYAPFQISFALAWFIVFGIVFSNIITANQFVVERYVFISSLGYCLLLSTLLVNYPNLFFFLVGCYTVRTMMHLWTFTSHEDFYLSNHLNFRNSEVALGNLGVIYLNNGKHGKAIDSWFDATKLNPFYDVPWYNLFSFFKSQNDFVKAKEFLNKCMNSKVLHFKEQWEKDSKEIDKLIEHQGKINGINAEMNKAINEHRFTDIEALKKKMDELQAINPLA